MTREIGAPHSGKSDVGKSDAGKSDSGSSDPETPLGKVGAPARRFPWGDRWIPALLLVHVLFLGSLWGLHFTGTIPDLKATGYDSIVTPGATTHIAAKFEVDGLGPFNPDLERIEIRFELFNNWGAAKTGFANHQGIASVEVQAPNSPGIYGFRGSPTDEESYRQLGPGAMAALWVWPSDASIIICDIDDTVTVGEGWKALLNVPGGPAARPGAAELLVKLSRSHAVVFLTARDDSLLNRTRQWLTRNRFPSLPVLCRDWTVMNAAKAGEFKLATLSGLKQRFSNVRCGIGNSEGDCSAYRGVGIPHVTLHESRCKGISGAPKCIGVQDWAAVAEALKSLLSDEQSSVEPRGQSSDAPSPR